jgi:hypothetical protein
MIKKLFSLLMLFLLIGIQAVEALHLSDRFLLPDSKPEIGAYVLMEHRGTYTILHLREYDPEQGRCAIEEIARPGLGITEKWDVGQWYRDGAPGASHWYYYQIDLKQGHVASGFDLLQVPPMPVEEKTFLNKLFLLSFDPLPRALWRKAGAPPRRGEVDERTPWVPNIYWKGNFIPDVEVSVWRGKMELESIEEKEKGAHQDAKQQELVLELYFAQHSSLIPAYFPAHLIIKHNGVSSSFKAVEFGNMLKP